MPLVRNGEVIEQPADHRTLTRRYTDEAVRFIDANKARPFFLYFAHTMPHIPLARSADYVGHSAAGIYGDVVEEIDGSAGRVLDALRTAGIDRRTLVVFTSDNGPWLPFKTHGGSAGPLSHGKGTTWEGGVRTPAIFWWPGTVRPATVTDIGSAMDLFTTAAKLAGAEVPADRVIDGVDLRARAHRIRPEPARSCCSTTRTASFVPCAKGAYKAHFITSGAYDDGEKRAEHNPPLLFNLADDPGERYDIAAKHPDDRRRSRQRGRGASENHKAHQAAVRRTAEVTRAAVTFLSNLNPAASAYPECCCGVDPPNSRVASDCVRRRV